MLLVLARAMVRNIVLIRVARRSDLDQITSIYDEAVTTRTSNCDLTPRTHDRAREWFKEHEHPYAIWVADDDGIVRGWTALSPYDSKPCFRRTATSSTYVRSRDRRKGIGTALRSHLIAEAQTRGFRALVNRIFADNDVSVRLTKKLGFLEIGHMHAVAEVDGEPRDCVLLQLLL